MIMMQLKCNGDCDDGRGNFGDNYIGEGLRRSGSEHVPNPSMPCSPVAVEVNVYDGPHYEATMLA